MLRLRFRRGWKLDGTGVLGFSFRRRFQGGGIIDDANRWFHLRLSSVAPAGAENAGYPATRHLIPPPHPARHLPRRFPIAIPPRMRQKVRTQPN